MLGLEPLIENEKLERHNSKSSCTALLCVAQTCPSLDYVATPCPWWRPTASERAECTMLAEVITVRVNPLGMWALLLPRAPNVALYSMLYACLSTCV